MNCMGFDSGYRVIALLLRNADEIVSVTAHPHPHVLRHHEGESGAEAGAHVGRDTRYWIDPARTSFPQRAMRRLVG